MSRSSVNFAVVSVILFSLLTNTALSDDFLSKKEWWEQVINNPTPYYGSTDDPPPAPVIAVAEWEPMEGVLINYPLLIPIELVAEMAEDTDVWSVVRDERQMAVALYDYVSAGVDTSSCHFLFTGDNNGPYTRDYGPWYIFNGNNELGINDNNYVPVGNPDDNVNQFLGDSLGIPVYQSGLNADGGNWITDGLGLSVTSDYTYWGNSALTIGEVDQLLLDYLGVINHNITVSWEYGHIDTFAKLLDPGRIVVIIPTNPNQTIEAAAELLSTLMSSYGRPYEVHRIQGSGYSNSLFLNNKVLVPQFGDPTDSAAVATFTELMPGYDVQGFFYQSFYYGDALHCRTHEMADRHMLRIVHIPLHDRENNGEDYYLEANVHAYSNEPLVGTPFIVWNVDGGVWNYSPMYSLGDDDWGGSIPQQPDGSEITYYLEAEDMSGRVENHPYIGAGNPHRFETGPDNDPPIVLAELPGELFATPWPLEITAYALDNRWISVVEAEWTLNGVLQDVIPLSLEEPYAVYYSGVLTDEVMPGDVIEIRIKAVDTSQNANTSYWPEEGFHTINIISPPDLMVNLTPAAIPTIVSFFRGAFDFNIEITNTTQSTQTVDIWTMITAPGGEIHGPIIEVYDYVIGAGVSIDRDRTQDLPRITHLGDYIYDAYIGSYPNQIDHEDHFGFTVEGWVDDAVGEGGWNNYGELFAGESVKVISNLPSEFVLHTPFPNPFNPTTTIRYSLPEAGKVKLTIYDIQGREVQSLVNGHVSSGEHQAVWNAEGFSSGVYFAKVMSGNQQQTQKLLLMK